MAESEKIEKYCKFCEKASAMSDPEQMLCSYRGVVSAANRCHRFSYDPLKRSPKRTGKEAELEYVDTDHAE